MSERLDELRSELRHATEKLDAHVGEIMYMVTLFLLACYTQSPGWVVAAVALRWLAGAVIRAWYLTR